MSLNGLRIRIRDLRSLLKVSLCLQLCMCQKRGPQHCSLLGSPLHSTKPHIQTHVLRNSGFSLCETSLCIARGVEGTVNHSPQLNEWFPLWLPFKPSPKGEPFAQEKHRATDGRSCALRSSARSLSLAPVSWPRSWPASDTVRCLGVK